jgi:hypothetical protein
MSNYDSKEFKKLQKEWYKKLEDTGFVDIEVHEGHHRQSRDKNHNTPTYRASKEEYYRMATYFLNDHKFKSNLEKAIWDYHTNGIGCRDIADLLVKTKVIKTNYTTVWQITKDLRQKMFKKYKVK